MACINPSVLKLNAHYKRRHPPINCEKCELVFQTPSSYTRHRYTHEEPRHKCDDCGKAFYFEGELKQHRTSHLKIRMHKCNYGKCTRSFMNKPDLLKHVRTHTNKPQKCTECEYASTDPRLFKNHLKLHTDDMPFKCERCNKAFRHWNQLRRHILDPKACVVKSNSPEY